MELAARAATEALGAHKAEIEKWWPIIKAAGISEKRPPHASHRREIARTGSLYDCCRWQTRRARGS